MTMTIGTRQVAIYARVSSDDQAERGTIATQLAEIDHWLARNPEVDVVERYLDDGVSGMIPLDERPAGSRLLRDAAARRFTEVLVYRHDRLGRDLVNLAITRRRFDELKITLTSVVERQTDLLVYDIQAAVAAHVRRELLRTMAGGMHRAAEEGRFTGGICPYGYRVEGVQETAHIVPDESIAWADRTCPDIVRQIYDWLAVDHWSCRRIATTLNAWGVPTHYARDERLVAPRKGERGQRTQAVWRSGRIRNLVRNPVYRGELQWGRRTTRADAEVISAPIEALVSPATWHAAQQVLAANRLVPKNTRRTYLLRGAVRCGIDGLTYVGSRGRDDVGWYRCNGQLVERGVITGKCWGQSIRTDALEPVIWADIERWLRDPGDLLDEIDGRTEEESQRAVAAVTSITLSRALAALDEQRQQALALRVRGRMTDDELDLELDRIADDKAELERRVAALEPAQGPEEPTLAPDTLARLRDRLDAGLTDAERQEIVGLLVRVVIHTETATEGRKKSARATIAYRLPAVVNVSTDRSSCHCSEVGRRSPTTRPRTSRESIWTARWLLERATSTAMSYKYRFRGLASRAWGWSGRTRRVRVCPRP
jgi:site-specific DNA recombinase